MSVKIKKEWFEDGGVIKQQLYVSGDGFGMSLKEKVIKGLKYHNDPKSLPTCDGCPYADDKWNGDDQGDCLWLMSSDALKIIKAHDFALSQYKETLEELIENNDGDVKEICVFLLNLLRIKEVDIEKGFYI